MSSKWKYFEEDKIPRACWAIVIMIIVLIFIGCIVGLIVWDGVEEPPIPPIKEPNTTDEFTFSQRLVAQKDKSAQDEIRVTDGSVLGQLRQLFIVPPTSQPAQVMINNATLFYEYNGVKANGFEVRWLDYVTKGNLTVKSIDLSDLKSFNVDVSELNLTSGATFTIQMNIKDQEGLESSVVSILDTPKTVKFLKNSFLGDGPGQGPDFSKITGVWLGGDFRSGGGNITMGNVKFDRSS